jgi:AcrR family transcriptional regulator
MTEATHERPSLLGRLFSCPRHAGETPHDHRRRHILEAATTCFARSGFHGASMQEICAEARMSPGALYRYFRSKDEMIEAIADAERVRNETMLAAVNRDGDLIDILVSVCLEYLSEMRRPGAAALMAEVYAESIRNTAIGARFLRNEVEVRDAIRTVLKRELDAGRIRPVSSLDACIGFVGAAIDGLVVRMAVDPLLTQEEVKPFLRGLITGVLRPVTGEAADAAGAERPAAADPVSPGTAERTDRT